MPTNAAWNFSTWNSNRLDDGAYVLLTYFLVMMPTFVGATYARCWSVGAMSAMAEATAMIPTKSAAIHRGS